MESHVSDHTFGPHPLPITALIGAYVGRPALVMGGGPSLPLYFYPELTPVELPADAVIISANGHGAALAAHGICRRPDYLICVDEIGAELAPWGIPLMARDRRHTQVELFTKPVHTSGMLGTVIAHVLGCSPVIPLGMDFYAGGTYWNDPKAKSTGNAVPYELHRDRWRKVGDVVPAAAIRPPPLSALSEIYAAYNPAEVIPEWNDEAYCRANFSGRRVRFLQRHRCHNGAGDHYHQPGEELEVSKRTHNQLVRARVAVSL